MPVARMKASLERALGEPAQFSHCRDRRDFLIVIGDPGLAARYHGVFNLPRAREARERLLANLVPIDEADAGNLHCGIDTAPARDQVEREVKPRRPATRHDEPLGFA